MGHTWLAWGQRGRIQGPPATLAAERSVSQFPISYYAKPGLSIWEQTLIDSRKSGWKAMATGDKDGLESKVFNVNETQEGVSGYVHSVAQQS